MGIARSLSRRLRLPGRIALILGLGALSTAGARADTPEQGKLTASGDVVVRSEGGRVFLSEGGRDAVNLLRKVAQAVDDALAAGRRKVADAAEQQAEQHEGDCHVRQRLR